MLIQRDFEHELNTFKKKCINSLHANIILKLQGAYRKFIHFIQTKQPYFLLPSNSYWSNSHNRKGRHGVTLRENNPL